MTKQSLFRSILRAATFVWILGLCQGSASADIDKDCDGGLCLPYVNSISNDPLIVITHIASQAGEENLVCKPCKPCSASVKISNGTGGKICSYFHDLAGSPNPAAPRTCIEAGKSAIIVPFNSCGLSAGPLGSYFFIYVIDPDGVVGAQTAGGFLVCDC